MHIVIVSIKHRGLKRWFYKEDPSGLTPHLVPIIDDILARLNVAEDVRAMNIPGWNLHQLTGELKGFWSVKVTRNWRIIFRFEGGNVFDVKLVDYH